MSDHFHVDWASVKPGLANGSAVPLGQDAEYQAEFYIGKVPNFEMTDYRELPHLRLQIPGSKTVYDQPARLERHYDRPSDPERFPHAWAAFLSGQDHDGAGTPLDQVEGIAANDIRRLEINGVRTIEQLASVADAHLDGLGFGGRVLRERARAFLIGRPSVDPEKAELKEQVGKLNDILSALLERTGISIDQLLPGQGEADGSGSEDRSGSAGLDCRAPAGLAMTEPGSTVRGRARKAADG